MMGIQILYPSGEEAEDVDLNLGLSLDIVAIHGLNGNPLNTWTEPKSQILWLRDFLPKDIPNARIMTFGYNATAAFERSTAGIMDHARDLLRCLEEARTEDEERERPLLFIAHSLGGLVLKQALVIAAEGRPKHYVPIWEAMTGICFFGTPHRGSSLATYGAQLARVPNALAMKPTPKLLKSLSVGSAVLAELNEKFRQLMSSRGVEEKKAVVSFYETRPLLGWTGLVVEQASALINPADETAVWEAPIPADAHHRDMCRFSSAENSTYETAVRRIQRLRGGGAEVDEVKTEHFVVPHAINPHFTGRNDIRTVMKDNLMLRAHSSKFAQKRFVLFGLGGSGKTQIALKFAQDYRKKFWGIFFIDASSSANAVAGFATIAKSLKLSSSFSQTDSVDRVKALLAKKSNWLFIIDNADDPRLDLLQFIPSADKSTVVITTRNPEAVKYANAGSYCVEKMNEQDAVTLLLKASGLGGRTDYIPVDEDTESRRKTLAAEIVGTLGFLALAIVQAGAVLQQQLVSLEGFCGLYFKRRKELLELGRSGSTIEHQQSVFTTWEISLRMIEKMEEKHALLALDLLAYFAFMHFDGIQEQFFEDAYAYMRGDIQYEGAEASILLQVMPDGWDILLVAKSLKLLASFSLISIGECRRISMHPLVHQWSKDRLSESDHTASWRRTVRMLSAAGSRQEYQGGYKRSKTLLPHVDACLSEGTEGLVVDGPDINYGLLAAVVFSRLYRESCRFTSMDLSQSALKYMEANFTEKSLLYITAMIEVGMCLLDKGQSKAAIEIWTRALEEGCNETKPHIGLNALGTAHLTLRISEAYIDIDQPKKAIETCQKLLHTHGETFGEDSFIFHKALEVLGMAYRHDGNLKEAKHNFEKSWKLQQRLFGPDHVSGTIAGGLPRVYKSLKMHKEARQFQQRYVEGLAASYGADDVRVLTEMARLQDFQPLGRTLLVSSKIRAKRIVDTKATLKDLIPTEANEDINIRALDCMVELAIDCFYSGSIVEAKLFQQDVVMWTTKLFGKDSAMAVNAVVFLKKINRVIMARKVIFWWLPSRFSGV